MIPDSDGEIGCVLCDHTSDTIEEHEQHMMDIHEPETVSIEGLGETGQTATVDQYGRISVGKKYEGETIRYAFEVVDDD